MGKRDNSLRDFALGGRYIPWWAVMASIIAAETSAATFLGAPGEGYDKRSMVYVQLVMGVIIGRFLIGNFFLKPYYTTKSTRSTIIWAFASGLAPRIMFRACFWSCGHWRRERDCLYRRS